MSGIMASIYALLINLSPVVTAAASGSSSFIGTMVKWAGSIGGGLVAIALIISLVKDGIGLAKGSGDSSIFKIIGKALTLIVVLGLVGLAINYTSLQNTGKNVGNRVIKTVNTELKNAGI